MKRFPCRWTRLLCLLLALVSVLVLTQPALAVLHAADPASAVTTKVRYSASSTSLCIGQLKNGTAVTVLGQRGNYYKVDLYDMTGYVAKSQLRETDGRYYVQCDPASPETSAIPYYTLTQATLFRTSLLQLAKEQLGSRYVYGGARPGAFDCSGLTYYVFGQLGFPLLRCADEQLANGIVIDKDSLQVGDLVFFRDTAQPYVASHVGIYIGNNQILHAVSKGVILSDLDEYWYAKYYLAARRVINAVSTNPETAPSALGGATGIRPTH